jgi:hypothetical protein
VKQNGAKDGNGSGHERFSVGRPMTTAAMGEYTAGPRQKDKVESHLVLITLACLLGALALGCVGYLLADAFLFSEASRPGIAVEVFIFVLPTVAALLAEAVTFGFAKRIFDKRTSPVPGLMDATLFRKAHSALLEEECRTSVDDSEDRLQT